MASTYVNDLRLNEMATGDESGNWGVVTNTNLELIGEALGYGTEGITTNADTHTTTIADGATDPGRAMFIKYTGTLDSACTITIAPNTVNRMHFIENGTTGSQNIIISQGTGANITIPAGDTKAVYLDGAGSGAAVVDAFASLNVVDLKVQDDLTLTDDLTLSSDSAVVTFGADGDTTLTHTDGTGLTLNSTNKICFNDASQFIQGSSATVLSLGATDEIDLTATAIDINGTLDVSGQATFSDGSAGAPSISNTGDANAGLYFSAADTLAFSAGGTGQFTMADGAISPVTDNDIDLGTASLKYKNFYAALVDGENFKVNGGQGSDGQVLTSTGSGVAWEAVSAGPTFKTFGTSSIMVGDDATGTIDAANYNTGLGVDIFAALTTGDGNIAIGFTALDANTTGNHNTAIGTDALGTNVTAHRNTAVGYEALKVSNVSGDTNASNTAVGFNAGVATTTGRANVFIGSQTGDANTTGHYNTGVGLGALGGNTTADSNTAVGYLALTTNSTGTLNTAVGVSALAANTTANSNTAIGDIALTSNTTGATNVAVGRNALGANTTASNSTAVGHGALESQTTGADNTAVGYAALASTNHTRNMGIGYRALTAQSGSSDNIAIGYDALVRQTTGANGNIAIGNYTGRAVVDSASTSQLVAIGHSVASNASGALAGYQNVFIGYNIASTSALAGAFQNTALGGSAMTALSTGDQNTCIGNRAGDAITTGSNNVLIGYDSGSDALTTVSTGSNNIVLGNNSTAVAEVKVDWTVGSDERDKTDIENLPNNAGLNFVNQLRPVTYVWDNRSNYYKPTDEKYGERDHSKKSTTKQVGFIAQEVKAIEESIGWTEDHIVNTSNEQSYKLTYSQVIPMLTKAVQELSAKVEELEKKLN